MEDKLQITYQQFQRKYLIQSEIGKGGFGRVSRIYNPRTKCRLALKTIMCTAFDQIRAAQQEIQIMSQLQHPHILKLFEFYQTCYRSTFKGDTTYFGMVLQLGQTSLQQSLKDPKYIYSIPDVRRFLAKLIEVGAFLQSKELVHCDIKPANIIIFGPGLDFKIGDFGLSCSAGRRPNAFVGSPHYCSPKLKEFYYNPKRFSKKPLTNAFKDDVYSVAVTVSQVLSKLNFDFKNQENCSSSRDLCQILEQMLRVQQKYRPTFEELMNSEFIRNELNMQSNFKKIYQEQHFKNIVLIDQPLNEMQVLTIKKEPNILQRNELVSHKYFKLHYCIRAIAIINEQYVLIGTDGGMLLVHDCFYNKSIVLNVRHLGHVSCITTDRSGRLYSAGGDGTIYCFNRALLIDLLQNKVQLKQIKKNRLYSKKKQLQSYQLHLQSEEYEVIQSFLEKRHISHLYCVDRQRIAVGYADGSVLLLWDKKSCHFQNYLGVVTSMKQYQHKLYVSFYSGNVVQLNLKQFKKEYAIHRFKDTVIDFNVIPLMQREGYVIEAFTCNGSIQKLEIQESGKMIFLQQKTIKHLIAANLEGDEIFLLSEDGVLLHDNEVFMRNEVGQSWCCLARQKGLLALGSFEGDLVLCKMNKANSSIIY